MDTSEQVGTAADSTGTTNSASEQHRSGDVTQFTGVDLTPDARFFVEFLDLANEQPDLCRVKPILAERLCLSADARVLDVGCGTGDDARMLGSLVAPAGRVIGVDASETMISVARERSRGSALPVEFTVGDACMLDFADDTFDAARCKAVLMHLEGEPAHAIAEMIRVTRAGGRIVLFDFHYDALAIDHPDRARTRSIVDTTCDGIRHGWIGSQLPRLAADAGLSDIQVEGQTLRFTYPVFRHILNGPIARAQQEGHFNDAEITQWWQPLDQAEARGQFMATMLTFIVTGTVPA